MNSKKGKVVRKQQRNPVESNLGGMMIQKINPLENTPEHNSRRSSNISLIALLEIHITVFIKRETIRKGDTQDLT